jgi:hypothetical protein
MSTALEIVNNSLRLCNELSGPLEVDPEMQNRGFDELVTMLNTMRGDGLYVTPKIPAALADNVQEYSWAKKGLEYDLAESLAPYLQVDSFTPSFYKQQKKAHSTLYVNAKPPTKQRLPEIFPSQCGSYAGDIYSGLNFYNRHDNIKYQYSESVNQGTAAIYVADFDSDATKRSTSVSSVAWTTEDGSATISNTSTSGSYSQSLITFSSSGLVKIKARAAYASGEIQDFDFRFNVLEAA